MSCKRIYHDEPCSGGGAGGDMILSYCMRVCLFFTSDFSSFVRLLLFFFFFFAISVPCVSRPSRMTTRETGVCRWVGYYLPSFVFWGVHDSPSSISKDKNDEVYRNSPSVIAEPFIVIWVTVDVITADGICELYFGERKKEKNEMKEWTPARDGAPWAKSRVCTWYCMCLEFVLFYERVGYCLSTVTQTNTKLERYTVLYGSSSPLHIFEKVKQNVDSILSTCVLAEAGRKKWGRCR